MVLYDAIQSQMDLSRQVHQSDQVLLVVKDYDRAYSHHPLQSPAAEAVLVCCPHRMLVLLKDGEAILQFVGHRVVPERKYRELPGEDAAVFVGSYWSLAQSPEVYSPHKRVANDAVKCWNPLVTMHDLQNSTSIVLQEKNGY